MYILIVVGDKSMSPIYVGEGLLVSRLAWAEEIASSTLVTRTIIDVIPNG